VLPPSVVYGPRGATSSGTSEPSHVHRLQPNRYSAITPTLSPFLSKIYEVRSFFFFDFWRICTFCFFEYDKAGQYALVSVQCYLSSTYPIYFFSHVIARSINQICYYVLLCFLLSSILFPLISFLLSIYVAVSLHK